MTLGFTVFKTNEEVINSLIPTPKRPPSMFSLTFTNQILIMNTIKSDKRIGIFNTRIILDLPGLIHYSCYFVEYPLYPIACCLLSSSSKFCFRKFLIFSGGVCLGIIVCFEVYSHRFLSVLRSLNL